MSHPGAILRASYGSKGQRRMTMTDTMDDGPLSEEPDAPNVALPKPQSSSRLAKVVLVVIGLVFVAIVVALGLVLWSIHDEGTLEHRSFSQDFWLMFSDKFFGGLF